MKRVIGVFLFLLLVVGVVSAEGMTHDASEICITVNGVSINLQEAINDNYFSSVVSWPSSSGGCNGAHDAGDILIENPDGAVMSFWQAASSTRLESGSSIAGDKTVLYAGHEDADDIILSSGETLQWTVDNYETDNCVSNAGDDCGGSLCVNAGTVSCDGVCVGANNKAEGTDCGGGKTCNSEGGCVGECSTGDVITLDCDLSDSLCRDYSDVSKTCDSSEFYSPSAISCNVYTDLARWTLVDSGMKACDGSGAALSTMTGYGCGDCPSGYRNIIGGQACRSYGNFPGVKCDGLGSSPRYWSSTSVAPGSSSTGGGTPSEPTVPADGTACGLTINGVYCSGTYFGGSCTCASTGGGCFVATEKVLTSAGYTEISKIREGDVAISYDEDLDDFTTSVVGDVLVHDGVDEFLQDYDKYPLLRLGIQIDGEIVYTEVTSNHPYFDMKSSWYKQIGKFEIGDFVKTIDGVGVIESMEELDKTPIVYNLHMSEGPSNYIVNGAVVHNAFEKDTE